MRPHLPPTPARRPDGDERGATLVEYAVLIAVLALPTVSGITMIQDAGEQKVAQSAEGISSREIVAAPSTTAGTGSTTSTTAAPSTSTTTTSTTSTTTTSTTTTSTTSTTTTTTPSGGTQSISTWGSSSTETAYWGYYWRGLAPITIKNESGTAVSGAVVVVKVQYRQGGSWKTASPDQSLTTGSNGTVNVASEYYRTSGSDEVTDVRFTIVSVTKTGLTWQGSPGTKSVDQP